MKDRSLVDNKQVAFNQRGGESADSRIRFQQRIVLSCCGRQADEEAPQKSLSRMWVACDRFRPSALDRSALDVGTDLRAPHPTLAQLEAWLQGLGLERYVPAFRGSEIAPLKQMRPGSANASSRLKHRPIRDLIPVVAVDRSSHHGAAVISDAGISGLLGVVKPARGSPCRPAPRPE